jgi:hypothetical protein
MVSYVGGGGARVDTRIPFSHPGAVTGRSFQSSAVLSATTHSLEGSKINNQRPAVCSKVDLPTFNLEGYYHNTNHPIPSVLHSEGKTSHGTFTVRDNLISHIR